MANRRFSRHRYDEFVTDYKARRLDEKTDEESRSELPEKSEKKSGLKALKGRAYLRDYLRWLRPHRRALITVALLALIVAGLQMIEPLFMRFIIDRVLLRKGLDLEQRMTLLNIAGVVFLVVIVGSRLLNVLKD